MRADRREWLAALAPAVLLAVFGAGGLAALAATIDAAARPAWLAPLGERAALLAFGWGLASLALGSAVRRLYRRHVAAAAQLAEQAAAVAAGQMPRTTAVAGSAATASLQRAIDRLAAQRGALEADIQARVQAASREVEVERSRLAALMAELTHSVVVCNLDGQVLLYNNRARWQFRALSQGGPAAPGEALLGIGRSIYAVFDRALVAHALESVQQRLLRGAAHPSTQFVTATRGGQLLRVQMAAVRGLGDEPALAGFVLMLENITRDFTRESERDRLLHQLTEASRSSLGNLQAAVELLDDPALDAPTRERFRQVVRDEAAAMSRRIAELAEHTTQATKTRWPLEPMRGADLVSAAQRRLASLPGLRIAADEVDPALWLEVDSYSLLLVVASLAERLRAEHGVGMLQLRLQPFERRARLDLVWSGPPMNTETVAGWETEALAVDGRSHAISLRDVVDRHGGAFWYERERAGGRSLFRLLLPRASGGEALEPALVGAAASRPEFYDFDLFGARQRPADLGARRLADLAYTVFDTETTGLDPGAGDEIIQIGATRIVAGKLRRQECFEQLVNPGRSVPAAGTAVHGISAAMLDGQPAIGEALGAFRAFAADTVLVAHNAAFDLRFLQLKEAATGVRFEQPVLDTLLLSAVVHKAQASHSLEEIAQRLGLPILGRHTALGDALLTAEIFLKLLPLLAEIGIETLAQALQASQQTWYARLRY